MLMKSSSETNLNRPFLGKFLGQAAYDVKRKLVYSRFACGVGGLFVKLSGCGVGERRGLI